MKYGRRPPKNAPALRLSSLLTGTVPAHPASEDYLANLSDWQMLGNDRWGDCVSVTWANERRILTHLIGAEHYPTLDAVIAFYKTQNPNFPADDNGMEIQTALEYLQKHGGPDGVKAIAFAKVNHANLEEVKAALAIFGVVWTGLTVLQANMNEFNAGQPWDYIPNSPVDGGHSVVTGGYKGDPHNDIRFITWAQETGFTANFWANEVEECWVVIWPEHLGRAAFQQGVNLQQLAADYQALTGKVLPLPTPTQPTPTPTPPPVPTPTPPPVPGPQKPSWWDEVVVELEKFVEFVKNLF